MHTYPQNLTPTSTAAASRAPAATDQHRAIAEVQAAMMIARANPRDQRAALDRILNACTRPSLASCAVYTYSRGGSDISGPSIRLAEAVAQQWGNMQFGIREIDQSGGVSTVQAYAWDVETNTRREVTFHVPLVRHTRKGAVQLTDPRDIYEHVANQGARRLRACILAVIPGDVTEAAVTQCEQTMHAAANTSPENLQRIVAAFEKFGVTRAQIEARIQRRLDAIRPAQVVQLQKIFASLKDGMSTAADWFDVDDAAAAPAAVAAEAARPALPVLDEARFAASLPKWTEAVASGRKTAADLLAMLAAKYSLSDAQIGAIRGISSQQPEETEQ